MDRRSCCRRHCGLKKCNCEKCWPDREELSQRSDRPDFRALNMIETVVRRLVIVSDSAKCRDFVVELLQIRREFFNGGAWPAVVGFGAISCRHQTSQHRPSTRCAGWGWRKGHFKGHPCRCEPVHMGCDDVLCA